MPLWWLKLAGACRQALAYELELTAGGWLAVVCQKHRGGEGREEGTVVDPLTQFNLVSFLG